MAIGISDIKSFVLQVILLTRNKETDSSRKLFAILIILLDLLLFVLVLRVYLFPNKRDLKETEHETYFKKTRFWNIVIDILSAVIFVVEIIGESLEKDGILWELVHHFF